MPCFAQSKGYLLSCTIDIQSNDLVSHLMFLSLYRVFGRERLWAVAIIWSSCHENVSSTCSFSVWCQAIGATVRDDVHSCLDAAPVWLTVTEKHSRKIFTLIVQCPFVKKCYCFNVPELQVCSLWILLAFFLSSFWLTEILIGPSSVIIDFRYVAGICWNLVVLLLDWGPVDFVRTKNYPAHYELRCYKM